MQNYLTNQNRFYVYSYLREDGTPYYIGKGTAQRVHAKHIMGGADITPDKSRRKILVDSLTEDEALELEEFLISEYGRKVDGGILINNKMGGVKNAGQVFSQETKELWSRQRTGKKHSAETRRKMSESQRGQKRSPEAREKMRQAALGRKHSAADRKKMSESAKKRHSVAVSCMKCMKEGVMPSMGNHLNICERRMK